MMGWVVWKFLGFIPNSETKKGKAPEYSRAECEMRTTFTSLSSSAMSRYLERSKEELMPQSSMILNCSSKMMRKHEAPSSWRLSTFLNSNFIC